MAQSSSAYSPFPFSVSNPNQKVTIEELKAFHNIDRILFAKLVFSLGRNPAVSMQVMALWLWLERGEHINGFVHKLLSMPDNLVNAFVDEAVNCLQCIECDEESGKDIPLTSSWSKTRLTISYFHMNRIDILRKVATILNDVCVRVFDDIIEAASQTNGDNLLHIMPVVFYYNVVGNYMGCRPLSDLAFRRRFINIEIDEILKVLPTSVEEEETNDQPPPSLPLSPPKPAVLVAEQTADTGPAPISVPVDNRTIFLTFSKGYPISEEEVRNFFTRKNGDCIESIQMQEVSTSSKQALYARMVIRAPDLIRDILEGKSKAKFSINGKHLWARKYVNRNNGSPSSPSSKTTARA